MASKQVGQNPKSRRLRLPTHVKPLHYDLQLEPSFESFNFLGHVKIQFETEADTKRSNIELHAVDMDITDGHIEWDAATPGEPKQKSKLTSVTFGTNETALLEFTGDSLPPKGTLDLKFKGKLKDQMKGFYRTAFQVGNETVYAATTQFAATDARRCFPCWDEPAIKATFTVGLIIDENQTIGAKRYARQALSNMPEESRAGVQGFKTLITFMKTPLMSTYLLAFAVGPFEEIQQVHKGRPIRVLTTPGKKHSSGYALEVAVKSLDYFEQYFGIDYPLPKMDLLAVPDFPFGAMENWGLITYRESSLLVDPKNTSTQTKQYVAMCIAHEISHQWFGNLVTMEWWTHLWLNEGFATFMQYLCIDSLFPEYEVWSHFVFYSLVQAMHLDAMRSSHPVEIPIRFASEVNEIFDVITYKKGASVIRMLYEYIGEQAFRSGMKQYLGKFAYKNAETTDLWDSLEQASDGKPVRELMSLWITQLGFPWIDVKCSAEQPGTGSAVKLTLRQSRFNAIMDNVIGVVEKDNPMWMVPISVTVASDNFGAQSTRELCLLSKETTEVTLEGASTAAWWKLNAGTIGMYRTAYPEQVRVRLYPAIADKSLPAMDRLGVLDDLYAMCQIDRASCRDLLQMLRYYRDEDVYSVWVTIDHCVARISSLLRDSPDQLRARYHAYARELFSLIYDKLGWDPKPAGETDNVAMTRPLVIHRLISMGDKRVIDEAKRRFGEHQAKRDQIPADLRGAVYKAIAVYGDDQAYEQLYAIHNSDHLNEEKNRVAAALGYSNQPQRVERVVAFVMSDAIRAQDKVYVFETMGGASPAVAWRTFCENKKYFCERCSGGMIMSRLIKSCVQGFTRKEQAQEVETYFKGNADFATSKRAIEQALETIKINAAWVERDLASIESFLTEQTQQ